MKKEIVDNDEITDNVSKTVENDRTIEDLKKIIQMKLENWLKHYLIILLKTVLKIQKQDFLMSGNF